jgi:O-antigen/teichoic acid export membrane protein
VLRNVGVLTGSQVVTWILAAIWTLFVPRRIGPEGMGLIVMAWAAAAIFQAFGSLGLRTMLVREIAADPQRAPQLIGSAMMIRAVSIIPCAAITGLYLRLGHFGPEHALVLYLATGVAVCTLFFEPLLAGFQALERMQYLAYTEVLNKGLLTACGIALVLMGFKAIALVALMLGAAIAVLVLNLFWSRRYFAIEWRIEPSRLRGLLRAALPYWSYGVFFNVYLWVASAMLAALTSTAAVGWYGGPAKLFGTLMFVPVILSMAWLPKLVSAYGEGPERLKLVAREPTEQIMILALPISVGAALGAGPLVGILYGAAFAPSVPVLVILALSVAPTYFNIVVNQILIACNRQMTWTKALGVACIVNPVLNLVLIQACQQRYGNGAIGAALAFLLTEVLLAGIGLIVIHPFLHAQTVSRLSRSAVATVGMAAVVYALSAGGLLLQIVAGGVTFLALALLLRVAPLDVAPGVERVLSRLAIRSWVRRLWAW